MTSWAKQESSKVLYNETTAIRNFLNDFYMKIAYKNEFRFLSFSYSARMYSTPEEDEHDHQYRTFMKQNMPKKECPLCLKSSRTKSEYDRLARLDENNLNHCHINLI